MQKTFQKRKVDKVLIILFIILASSIIAQFTLFRENKSNTSGSQTTTSGAKIDRDNTIKNEGNKVTIDFGDGRKVTQNADAKSALSALEKVASGKGYKIITKEYKYGSIVEEVNRVKNTSANNWIYSVNGIPGKIAADRYILNPGDEVEWKYSNAE